MKESRQKSDGNQEIPHIKEGPPIWVESLMSYDEIRHYRKIYNTYVKKFIMIADFRFHQRWRYGMGSHLLMEERENFNLNIEKLRAYRLAKLRQTI
jgi:hypothetical protein